MQNMNMQNTMENVTQGLTSISNNMQNMSVSARKVSDGLFQKSLQDLIKGIRGARGDVSEYISKAIAESKTELKSTDTFMKAEAIRKLTYLQMQGYNISWAAFSIVEVMSQPRFAHRRVGYLAANQSFTEQTDVLLLTTNLFKKEFTSRDANQYDIGSAINCLANITNLELARDCIGDVVNLMNSPRPYVRKKAVLAMYKLYIKFPQGLRLTFEKLNDRLDDPEQSVVSTAVNVICELANKNPKNYLSMAPKFFKILTTSTNNWMLIKIVKLFGSLVPEEPRLARKLLDPLATIITNTTAKSLQYECIYTITVALPHSRREDGSEHKNTEKIIKLCSDYLREFVEDSDQNLKYLGLVGLVQLMDYSPRTVVSHRENILKCLNDDDVTIRTRALELLAGIVSRKSLQDLVHHLLEHVKYAEGEYRDEIISKVIHMCSKDKYALLSDFAWYTSILLDLATTQGSRHGPEVADQLIEVALRVDYVRPYAVEAMLTMLFDNDLVLGQARNSVTEVLKAAAWIVGEYSSIVASIANNTPVSEEDDGYVIEGPNGEHIRSSWTGTDLFRKVIEVLMHPRTTNLPAHVQCVYVQSVIKLFVRAARELSDQGSISSIISLVRYHMVRFLQSPFIEVQERSSTFRYILDELDILPANWQDVEKSLKEQEEQRLTAAGQAPMADLDLMSFEFNSSSELDTRGASMAKAKAKVLSAIINEPFYAVHSKAQKRVQLSEEVDIDAVLQPEALEAIMSAEIDANISLNTISFGAALPTPAPDLYSNIGYYLNDDKKDKEKESDGNTNTGDSDSVDKDGEENSESNNSKTPDSSNYIPTTQDTSMFYLSGTGGSTKKNVAQLGDILAESFEENKGKSKKKKKDKKDKKVKKRDIQFNDIMPAGIDSDDDDEDLLGNKKKNKSSSRRSNGNDDDGLGAIDLTKPLGRDEKLPELKHREVVNSRDSTNSSSDAERRASWRETGATGFGSDSFASATPYNDSYADSYEPNGDKDKSSKKSKKHKKDKEKKSSKKKEKETPPQEQALHPVLKADKGLMASLGAGVDEMSDRKVKKDKKDKKEKKDSKEKEKKGKKKKSSSMEADLLNM